MSTCNLHAPPKVPLSNTMYVNLVYVRFRLVSLSSTPEVGQSEYDHGFSYHHLEEKKSLPRPCPCPLLSLSRLGTIFITAAVPAAVSVPLHAGVVVIRGATENILPNTHSAVLHSVSSSLGLCTLRTFTIFAHRRYTSSLLALAYDTGVVSYSVRTVSSI